MASSAQRARRAESLSKSRELSRKIGWGERRNGGYPPMDREVPCSAPKCRNPASYKIAAPWSDGRCEELTTYSLACRDHFAIAYRDAERRKLKLPPTSTEKVGEVGIYRCQPD